MITPLPNAWLQKPGSATLPFFGVVPVLLDEKGHEVKGEGEGYLCIKQAWPSTLRTVYGDHERYETNYFKPFPGYYFSGGAVVWVSAGRCAVVHGDMHGPLQC
jgi:acetyl-CoA synthetase